MCLVCLCFIMCYTTALEANMKEPSCDELREMWRFSKRQSRAAEKTNEIPRYRDPFAFNVWDEYGASPRNAGRGGRYKKPPVYGTLVPGPAHLRSGAVDNYRDRIRAFEEVMRLFDASMWPPVSEGIPRRRTSFRYGGRGSGHAHTHPTQSGSFQHLKELIRNERARELQEQRMNEEVEQAKMQYPRMNDSPPSSVEEIRQKTPVQGKGVVAFPDILLPPSYKYIDDYPATTPQVQKYRNKYPETNSV